MNESIHVRVLVVSSFICLYFIKAGGQSVSRHPLLLICTVQQLISCFATSTTPTKILKHCSDRILSTYSSCTVTSETPLLLKVDCSSSSSTVELRYYGTISKRVPVDYSIIIWKKVSVFTNAWIYPNCSNVCVGKSSKLCTYTCTSLYLL